MSIANNFTTVLADATVIKTAIESGATSATSTSSTAAAGTAADGADTAAAAEGEPEPDPDAVLDGELSRYLLTEEEQKKR